ncbi:dihydrofolate reductase family protein [Lentilitoribacter sp. EG35]|uniref:dihydrofolate reductase family protein n=1 Tax=Lentilitoribacter sp. EG35 TaxID=3234192 RepID=UPI003460AFAA
MTTTSITGHVFIATSLDGFVARNTDNPETKLDWLMKQDTVGEDHGYDDFIESVDGLVMGRGSFETLLGFEGWPYGKPVIVVSQSLTKSDVPDELSDKVELVNLTPHEIMDMLDKRGWKRAYIDGGKLIQSFIQQGLIEDITLTRIPILIGSGISLFGDIDQDIDLELKSVKAFESGLVTSVYGFA